MNKFLIEYYCEKHHTGELNYNKTRTGVVFAKNRKDAVLKVRLTDDEYIGIKNMTFEEIKEGGGSDA